MCRSPCRNLYPTHQHPLRRHPSLTPTKRQPHLPAHNVSPNLALRPPLHLFRRRLHRGYAGTFTISAIVAGHGHWVLSARWGVYTFLYLEGTDGFVGSGVDLEIEECE